MRYKKFVTQRFIDLIGIHYFNAAIKVVDSYATAALQLYYDKTNYVYEYLKPINLFINFTRTYILPSQYFISTVFVYGST